MAIRRRGNSYQVYWRDPETKKIVGKSFSTLEEAEKENATVLYLLKNNPSRISCMTQTKETERRKERREVVVTVADAFLSYVTARQFTTKQNKSQYAVLRPVLKKIGETPLEEVTPKMIEDLIPQIMSEDKTRATTNARFRILRAVIYFAQRQGYCPSWTFPRIPSPQYKVFVPPTPEELDTMFQVAAPHVQRVIILGAYCGVRVGCCELYSLTWDDVDLAKRVLRVHGSKKNENSPYREVPIRESLLPLFEEWQREDVKEGVKNLIHFQGQPVKSIKGAWETVLKNAGITRRLRPYDLRHAFGTELVAAGIDIGTVAKLMGHSSPTMLLKHYQYVLDRQKIEAVERLPPLSCMSK